MAADTTRAAISALGTARGDDYLLRPELHASALPPVAGALARVLRRAEVEAIISAYGAADQAAIKHQSAYKWFGRLSLRATFLAALAGGVSLALLQTGTPAGPMALLDQVSAVLHGAAAITPAIAFGLALYGSLLIQFLAISAAFAGAAMVRRSGLFDLWNTQRGLAELHRRQLFETVVAGEEPQKAGEIALLPLQLEYFRRYQLDVQLTYYRRRGEEHQQAAEGTKGFWGSAWRFANFPGTPFAVFILAMVALVLQSALALNTGLMLTMLGLLGVAGTGLTSYFNGVSALNQDRLNAARYNIAARNLEFLLEQRLDPVRASAAAGEKAAVRKFVDDVNAQISTEHREWYLLHDAQTQPGLTVARPSL
jgi:hypothetical protein